MISSNRIVRNMIKRIWQLPFLLLSENSVLWRVHRMCPVVVQLEIHLYDALEEMDNFNLITRNK